MMKATLTIAAILISFACSAQKKIVKDADGNYKEVKITTTKTTTTSSEPKKNGKTFTTANGEEHDVYVGPKGKPFVIRVSKKTGKEYKQYLTKATQE